MDNPFSWDYLTAPLRDVPTFGPFSAAFVALFATTFVVSAVAYMSANKRLATNPLLREAVRTGSQIMMWLTGTGLFFFAWRAARIDFATLHMRLWSYLFLLAYVGVVGYFIYWYRTTYREQLASIERERIRRQYNPSARTRKSSRRKSQRGVR